MNKFEGNLVISRFWSSVSYFIRFIETENFIQEEVLVDVHVDDETYQDHDFVISEQQLPNEPESEKEKENDNNKRK